MSQIFNRCILFSILYFRLCRRKAEGLSLPVLADGVVHGAHVVPRLALQVHPVVPVLPREGEAVLVVNVVRLSLVPGGVVPGVATRPLPGPLGEEVHPSQPVAVGEVPSRVWSLDMIRS